MNRVTGIIPANRRQYIIGIRRQRSRHAIQTDINRLVRGRIRIIVQNRRPHHVEDPVVRVLIVPLTMLCICLVQGTRTDQILIPEIRRMFSRDIPDIYELCALQITAHRRIKGFPCGIDTVGTLDFIDKSRRTRTTVRRQVPLVVGTADQPIICMTGIKRRACAAAHISSPGIIGIDPVLGIHEGIFVRIAARISRIITIQPVFILLVFIDRLIVRTKSEHINHQLRIELMSPILDITLDMPRLDHRFHDRLIRIRIPRIKRSIIMCMISIIFCVRVIRQIGQHAVHAAIQMSMPGISISRIRRQIRITTQMNHSCRLKPIIPGRNRFSRNGTIFFLMRFLMLRCIHRVPVCNGHFTVRHAGRTRQVLYQILDLIIIAGQDTTETLTNLLRQRRFRRSIRTIREFIGLLFQSMLQRQINAVIPCCIRKTAVRIMQAVACILPVTHVIGRHAIAVPERIHVMPGPILRACLTTGIFSADIIQTVTIRLVRERTFLHFFLLFAIMRTLQRTKALHAIDLRITVIITIHMHDIADRVNFIDPRSRIEIMRKKWIVIILQVQTHPVDLQDLLT